MILIILLMTLVMSVGLYSFNTATEVVVNEKISVTELQAFNSQFEQFEGMQSGTNVKVLMSNVMANVGTNSDDEERLPDITFIDSDNSEFTIISVADDTGMSSMSKLRAKISNSHNYTVTLEYNPNGYVDDIIITY